MTGYREDNFDLAGRRRKTTRLEKGVAVVAIIVGLLMLANGFARGDAPAWLRALDLDIAPIGVLNCLLAVTFLERARANRPDETSTSASLRTGAAMLFLLGLAIIAVGLHHRFTGA
jgi:uncharacterized membrane protein